MRALFVFLVSVFLSLSAVAASQNNGSHERIKAQFKTLMPELTIDQVSATPIKGLYLISSGPQVIYMSEDGKYLIQGDMYDVQNEEAINLTENAKQKAVKKTVDAVNKDTLIIYPAKNEKTYITVLTDPDCTYCRALHREIPKLNDAGITVRYVAFPRTPQGTPSYNKSVYIWCAEDRNKAFTDAINDKAPAATDCKNPVAQHRELVRALDVNVTPVIIFENGRMLPGYLPADKLIEAVEQYGR